MKSASIDADFGWLHHIPTLSMQAAVSLKLTSGILNSGSASTNTLPSHWRSS